MTDQEIVEGVKNIEATGFYHLHPAVQCTIVIFCTMAWLGLMLALFTDFWNNLGRKK